MWNMSKVFHTRQNLTLSDTTLWLLIYIMNSWKTLLLSDKSIFYLRVSIFILSLISFLQKLFYLMQTVQILIRQSILLCLLWVYTVCQGTFKGWKAWMSKHYLSGKVLTYRQHSPRASGDFRYLPIYFCWRQHHHLYYQQYYLRHCHYCLQKNIWRSMSLDFKIQGIFPQRDAKQFNKWVQLNQMLATICKTGRKKFLY